MRARHVSADVSDHRWVALVRRLSTGLGAGVVGGALVGGLLGRLAMALLRATSPRAVVGVTSDDGFEIGQVSVASLQLVVLTGIAGGLSGLIYTVFGTAVRQTRLRIGLWTAMGGAVGGALIVHSDGVDFTLLKPAWLAVGLFVLLPALGAFTIAVLAERWAGVGAAAATFGPPAGTRGRGLAHARRLVPIVAGVAIVAGLVDLIVDIAEIT